MLVFVTSLYRRDSVELRPGLGLVLLALRVTALLGVLAYFLELEKRTERTAVHNSRVLVLVDTSLSMGLQDRRSRSDARGRLRGTVRPRRPTGSNKSPPCSTTADSSVACARFTTS